MSLDDNISAREAFTRVLTGKPEYLTAAEAEDALFGHVYKGPGMPTIDDVRAVVELIRRDFGNAEVRALLQRHGVEKVSDLWIGMYQEIIDFANQCFEYDTPPSASWTDGVPTVAQEL